MTLAFASLRSTPWLCTLLALATAVAAGTSLTGCLGPCGAVAVQTDKNANPNARASVDGQGVVHYDPVRVGASASFDLPVKDSADVAETLVGATIVGADADAFEVHATFPLDMPRGAQVHLEVTFHPTKPGQAKAELDVDTEAMGISPIVLTGEGLPAGGS